MSLYDFGNRIHIDRTGPQVYIEVDGQIVGYWDTDMPNQDLAYNCGRDECEWLVLDGEGDVDVVNGWHEFKTCECSDYAKCPLNEDNYEDFFPWDLNDMLSLLDEDHVLDDLDQNASAEEIADVVNEYFGSGDFNDYWDYQIVER